MYPNIPKKMRRNAFKHCACPSKRKLYAQCAGLTVPKYPTGQTAIVDVDPVEVLARVAEEEYAQYEAMQNASEQQQ